MPQLAQASTNVQKFFLPSTENLPEADRAWVKLDMSPATAADLIDTVTSDVTSQGTLSGAVVAHRIKEWNFTAIDGSPEPITLENVKRLDPADYADIYQRLQSIKQPDAELSDTEKKA